MSKRLEREIEEILQQAELPPPSPKAHRGGGRRAGWGSYRVQDALQPKKLFLVSLVLFLSWLVLWSAGAGGPWRSVFFSLALVLFIVGYALYFVRSENTPERRWRGQVVDYGDGNSWRDRLRRWLA